MTCGQVIGSATLSFDTLQQGRDLMTGVKWSIFLLLVCRGRVFIVLIQQESFHFCNFLDWFSGTLRIHVWVHNCTEISSLVLWDPVIPTLTFLMSVLRRMSFNLNEDSFSALLGHLFETWTSAQSPADSAPATLRWDVSNNTDDGSCLIRYNGNNSNIK